jgi:hypothetical protein
MAFLDQYRDEILDLYQNQRLTIGQIHRALENRHGITIPRSTFIMYIRTLNKSSQEDLREEAAMRGVFKELPEA